MQSAIFFTLENRTAPHDRSTDRMIDRSNDRSISRSVDRSIGRSIDRSIGRSVDRSIGRSVDRSIGRSIDRSIGRSVDRSIGRSVCELHHFCGRCRKAALAGPICTCLVVRYRALCRNEPSSAFSRQLSHSFSHELNMYISRDRIVPQ